MLIVSINHSLYRHITGLEGSRRLRFPDLETVETWWWYCCQPYESAAFTPQKIFLVLIFLEAEFTLGP